MKTAKVIWRDEELIVRCPHCKREDHGGGYLAAHAIEFNKVGGTFRCEKKRGETGDPTRLRGCGKKSVLGKIPAPPKAKGLVR